MYTLHTLAPKPYDNTNYPQAHIIGGVNLRRYNKGMRKYKYFHAFFD